MTKIFQKSVLFHHVSLHASVFILADCIQCGGTAALYSQLKQQHTRAHKPHRSRLHQELEFEMGIAAGAQSHASNPIKSLLMLLIRVCICINL
jgi:hypothetical protein